MANWVYNHLTLNGTPADLLAFVERVRSSDPESPDDDTVLDFEQLDPMPDELRENDDIDPRDPHGFPEWRTWRVEHWGTKWNAWYASREGDASDGEVSYSFQTALTPPDRWFREGFRVRETSTAA